MSKRFVETDRWKKAWFRKLPCRLKAFWDFLCENCDQAGVWEPDFELASFLIGEKVSAEDSAFFQDQVKLMPNGKWHLLKFVEFQYGPLSKLCPPHKRIMALLAHHGIVLEEHSLRVPPRVGTTLEEEEEEEDKEEDKEEDQGVSKGGLVALEASPPKANGSVPPPRVVLADIRTLLDAVGELYGREHGFRPTHVEETDALKVVQRLSCWAELKLIQAWRSRLKADEVKYFPQTLESLLSGWDKNLDRARIARKSAPVRPKFGVGSFEVEVER